VVPRESLEGDLVTRLVREDDLLDMRGSAERHRCRLMVVMVTNGNKTGLSNEVKGSGHLGRHLRMTEQVRDERECNSCLVPVNGNHLNGNITI
jgi:hypothetical protein